MKSIYHLIIGVTFIGLLFSSATDVNAATPSDDHRPLYICPEGGSTPYCPVGMEEYEIQKIALSQGLITLGWILVPGCLFLVMAVIWSRSLQIKVRQKTSELQNEIRERKATESVLRESEEQFRAFFDSVGVGTAIIDNRLMFTQVNDRLCQITGFRREELINMEVLDLDLPGELEADRHDFERMFNQPDATYDLEKRLRRKDGQPTWVRISLSMIKDTTGTPLRAAAVVEEINARKLAQIDRERLKTAIEQSAEIVVITDPEGLIEYVNPAFEKMTGYSRDEALGQNPRVLKSGNQSESFYQQLWHTISSGQSWQGRFINKRKDGTHYTEDASISPVVNDAGKITQYVAVKQDISNQLNLEEQLRQANKLNAIGTLSSGIAHDFNNILTSVLGYSEMIQRKLQPGSQDAADIQKVILAGQRGQTLINQMLTFARQKKQNCSAVAIEPIIEDVLSFVRSSIPPSVEIQTHITAANTLIVADPIQIHQILMNLCINAFHAMNNEQGIIVITLEKILRVPADTNVHDRTIPHVRLTVKDDGQGISPASCDKIFDPFFTTREVGKGSGLGLSVVYGEVQSLGGVIKVESQVGVGSLFTIYLPCAGHPKSSGNKTTEQKAEASNQQPEVEPKALQQRKPF